MNFATGQFIVFFAVVVAIHWTLPWRSPRKLLLLGASYYFYACWDWRFLGLILLSTTLDYSVGVVLDRHQSPRVRKAALVASCVGNLGILATFKYAGFFAKSFAQMVEGFGGHPSSITLDIVLPVGISFYTFQTLSYTIDLYLNRIERCRSILDFSLFVAFFPQLVAGPIVRASMFLPQLATARKWRWRDFRSGSTLMLKGLAKKVVIADTLAFAVDPVFAQPSDFGLVATWIAVVSYAFQIYCDFSGYSDVAVGAARILGYRLPSNFDHPYLAMGIRDFWRRWHISLSSWLRDYLYFPLGGGRTSERRTYLNIMITMALGGLWHGAAWTFVAWGIYHGVLVCLSRRFTQAPVNWAPSGMAVDAARTLGTFVLVCLGWPLFRSQSFSDALQMLMNMCGQGTLGAGQIRLSALWLLGLAILTQLLAATRERFGWDYRSPLFVRAMLVAGCMIGIFAFARQGEIAFIYFQF